jgi:hypothetical protein
MHTPESIRRIDQIFVGRSIELPERPGVYAFWWIGPRANLMAANRHIVLKGPGERPVDVEYQDWWPKELVYPPLYVGKTTNIKNRFSQHIKRDCPGRLHQAHPENVKAKPCTTTVNMRGSATTVPAWQCYATPQRFLDLLNAAIRASGKTV